MTLTRLELTSGRHRLVPNDSTCGFDLDRAWTHKHAAKCGWRQLGESEVVGCEFVVASGDTPTLLDHVKEVFDEIVRAIQVTAEANWLLSLALRRNIGSSALLIDERSDPVGVILAICQQHGLRLQSRQ